MEKIQKNLSRNESLVSMLLGAVVVILVGVLAYNYFRTQRATIPQVTTPNPSEKSSLSGQLGTAQTAVALPTTYTVVAGDHLWGIAEKFYQSGYNYVDIARVNKLANPGKLEVGQKLTIPKVEIRQPLTVKTAVSPQITLSRIEGDRYTVQKGDYLWQIALRAYGDGYRWVDIAKTNNLANPNVIHPGNELKLPR